MTEIAELLKRVRELSTRQEEISRATGTNFNVFKLCEVNHYENRHSDIIAEFLNPKGSHGCGSDFLGAFCQIVKLDFRQYENANTDVIREHAISGGRFDILIQSRKNKIVIENKIYADEGDGQLKKYRKWLDDTSGENSPLFFLTLDGRKSEGMTEGYKPISYKEHIIPWLTECIRIASKKRKTFVKEPLVQYKKLIEELTGGSIMTQKEVIECIQGNFQAALAVARSLNNAKAQWFCKYIVDPLLDKGVIVDVEKGEWQQLIRSGNGKEYLDCFFSRREGRTEVVYAYSYNFQNPRCEITTYSDSESKTVTTRDNMPHAIPDDLWGNPDKAENVVRNILEDIKEVLKPGCQEE